MMVRTFMIATECNILNIIIQKVFDKFFISDY
jgi:hypothetical protein